MEKLEEGFYVLTQDVENPHSDRRAKSWVYWPVWKAGWTFYVRRRNEVARVEMFGEKTSEYLHDYADKDGFNAIVQHLVPDNKPETYKRILRALELDSSKFYS